jgi:hypothetical protein
MPYKELHKIMQAAELLIPEKQLEKMTVEITVNEQNSPKMSLISSE